MSQTQLHGTTSSELAGRRRWPLIVPALFALRQLGVDPTVFLAGSKVGEFM